MANAIIENLYSNTSGNKPTKLNPGQIAINRADKLIYISDPSNNVVPINGGGSSSVTPTIVNLNGASSEHEHQLDNTITQFNIKNPASLDQDFIIKVPNNYSDKLIRIDFIAMDNVSSSTIKIQHVSNEIQLPTVYYGSSFDCIILYCYLRNEILGSSNKLILNYDFMFSSNNKPLNGGLSGGGSSSDLEPRVEALERQLSGVLTYINENQDFFI